MAKKKIPYKDTSPDWKRPELIAKACEDCTFADRKLEVSPKCCKCILTRKSQFRANYRNKEKK